MTGELHLKRHTPRYIILSEKGSSHYASLPAVFNLLPTSMNREIFEKQLCNQSSQHKKCGRFSFMKGSITKLTLFTVSKIEWNTKEDTGKSMKNAKYILWYAKRYLLG